MLGDTKFIVRSVDLLPVVSCFEIKANKIAASVFNSSLQNKFLKRCQCPFSDPQIHQLLQVIFFCMALNN